MGLKDKLLHLQSCKENKSTGGVIWDGTTVTHCISTGYVGPLLTRIQPHFRKPLGRKETFQSHEPRKSQPLRFLQVVRRQEMLGWKTVILAGRNKGTEPGATEESGTVCFSGRKLKVWEGTC